MKEHAARLAAGVDLLAGAQTLEAWLWFWFDNYKAPTVQPATAESYRRMLARYVVPALGHHRLDKLTADHVVAWRNLMTANLHGSEPGNCYSLLYEAMEQAVQSQRLVRNVVAAVRRPAKSDRPESERRALSEPEFVAVLDACYLPERYLVLYLMGLLGLRRGEALGLRWVDVAGGKIRVTGQVQRIWQQTMRLDTAKRGSFRTLPQPPHVAELLRREKLRQQEATIAAGGVWDEQALVFGLHNPQSINNYWADALQRAGVAHLPLHSLRHTATTRLDVLGVRESVIKAILGHSKKADVTARYKTISDADMRQALEAAEAAVWQAIRNAMEG